MRKEILGPATLFRGDSLEVMAEMEAGSVDAVISDPPYPEISRPYGRMTEPDWHRMMDGVVGECRRLLRPRGSAVFVLQPNMERIGRMRPWLWQFMARWAEEWNMVQDVWWWNVSTLPQTKDDPNLLRASVKACVWLGASDCYRDAAAVRWQESDSNKAQRAAARCTLQYRGNGSTTVRDSRARNAAVVNGGTTPFNLIPCGVGGIDRMVQHPARTPLPLCSWWVRYISPEGSTVADPFMGSGTTGVAAITSGRRFVGIERDPGYFDVACRRIEAAQQQLSLFGPETTAPPPPPATPLSLDLDLEPVR